MPTRSHFFEAFNAGDCVYIHPYEYVIVENWKAKYNLLPRNNTYRKGKLHLERFLSEKAMLKYLNTRYTLLLAGDVQNVTERNPLTEEDLEQGCVYVGLDAEYVIGRIGKRPCLICLNTKQVRGWPMHKIAKHLENTFKRND